MYVPIFISYSSELERNETDQETHETEIEFEQKYHCLDCNMDFEEDDINLHSEEFEHYRIEKVEQKSRKNLAKCTYYKRVPKNA